MSRRPAGTMPRRRVGPLSLRDLMAPIALLALLLPSAGCATQWITVREVPDSPLVERLHLTSWSGPKPSPRTVQTLRRYGLEDDIEGDRQRLLTGLQNSILMEPTSEKLYAFAEMAYLAGKRIEHKDQRAALDFFGASVTHAYWYLFDPRFRGELNPYDPQFRSACDLYNGALADALRIVQKQGSLLPGRTHTIHSASQAWDVAVVPRGHGWHAEEFERFEFAADFEIQGLRNQYRNFGLGVPLIAVRKKLPEGDPREKLYPPGLSFPVTAFLRVLPDEPDALPGTHRALLELYDPLMTSELSLEERRVPLESDLTTPLAYFLSKGSLPPLATLGLLRVEETQKLRGLYLAQPYEPDKIPVLFVHGLWSDPTTWTEMFNDLRASPEIRQRYQFWFYFYPSGQPFWLSAAQLRKDLDAMRLTLDPRRQAPALDEMVLVGHSMGGLVSTLQALDSGDAFWQTAARQPIQLVKASEDARGVLASTYYFRANPSVRRVITIGTPHHGGRFINGITRYVGERLIMLPRKWVEGRQDLFRDNPDAFPGDSSLRLSTSIDSLSPDSSFLPVMLAADKAPWVRFHNIIGVSDLDESGAIPEGATDGAVLYASAHLDNAHSELVVPADHLGVHRHPLSVLEVRRILLEHLGEIRSRPPSDWPEPMMAAPPAAAAGPMR